MKEFILRFIGYLDWPRACVLAYGVHWGIVDEGARAVKYFSIRVPIPFSEYYDRDMLRGPHRGLYLHRRELIVIRRTDWLVIFGKVSLRRIV